MTTNLVLSGGPLHDFNASTQSLVQILAEEGIESTVFDDPHLALRTLAEQPDAWDLLTVNALWWEMQAERHEPLRSEYAFTLSDAQGAAIEAHVKAGGGLLACHSAVICFSGAPRWQRCIGATWNWDRSSHPPEGPAEISVTGAGRDHPITAHVDPFVTDDEIYGFLDVDPTVVPLLTSAHGGVDHPVLWARQMGAGRVVTDVLGHEAAAFDQPDHRQILRSAARWLTNQTGSDHTS